MSEIVVVHEGVRITYLDASNEWSVDDHIHGLTFRAESLDKAKKKITVALRMAKKGRFTSVPALMIGGYYDNERVRHVDVTSFVERKNYNGDMVIDEAWISFKTGERKRKE